MEKFTILEGVAAPIDMINVDTDMIIPKQYLKTIKRTGLGKGLFAERRYRDDGSENRISCSTSRPIARRRFSSRATISAAAPRASMRPGRCIDFGIRCVISTTFGDIFYNNCFKNGILPIKVSPEDLEKLFDDAIAAPMRRCRIDLAEAGNPRPTAVW